jgi:hypothetical protein
MTTFSEAFGVNKFLSLPIDLSTAGMLSFIFQVLTFELTCLKRLVLIKQREQEEQYPLIAEMTVAAMI